MASIAICVGVYVSGHVSQRRCASSIIFCFVPLCGHGCFLVRHLRKGTEQVARCALQSTPAEPWKRRSYRWWKVGEALRTKYLPQLDTCKGAGPVLELGWLFKNQIDLRGQPHLSPNLPDLPLCKITTKKLLG